MDGWTALVEYTVAQMKSAGLTFNGLQLFDHKRVLEVCAGPSRYIVVKSKYTIVLNDPPNQHARDLVALALREFAKPPADKDEDSFVYRRQNDSMSDAVYNAVAA
jgi:hypothetical protein